MVNLPSNIFESIGATSVENPDWGYSSPTGGIRTGRAGFIALTMRKGSDNAPSFRQLGAKRQKPSGKAGGKASRN